MKTSRDEDALIGLVRTVRIQVTISSDKSSENAQKSRRLWRAVTYDVEGYKTEEALYNTDGQLSSKTVFIYDNKGKLIEASTFASDNLLSQKSIYIRNPDRKRVEEHVFNANGALIGKNMSLYDDKNRVTELAVYEADGSLSHKMSLCYDNKGRTSEIATYIGRSENFVGGDIQSSERRSMVHADMGEKLTVSTPHGEALLAGKVAFTYDDEGTIITKSEYGGNGSLVGSKSITADAKGNVVEITEYSLSGHIQSKVTFVREFDSHDNWIKEIKSRWKIETDESELTQTTYRTITYY